MIYAHCMTFVRYCVAAELVPPLLRNQTFPFVSAAFSFVPLFPSGYLAANRDKKILNQNSDECN